MSEDVYVLKRKLNSIDLQKLNKNPYESNTRKIFAVLNVAGNIDRIEISQVEDWIAALKSGKKIVNPMSPREELIKIIKNTAKSFTPMYRDVFEGGVKAAIECIAKEHPDVADWLKDGESNG